MKITMKKALALMEQAVEERGREWTFPINAVPMGCFYVVTDEVWEDASERCEETAREPESALNGMGKGSPACLVGLALSYLHDVTVDRVMRENNYDNIGALSSWLESSGVELTDKARAVFESAQDAQDGGDSWGHALEAAKARAETL